jgi:hypothetical protein
MSVCVYSVFMLSCVQAVDLRWADPQSKESNRLCKNQETEKADKVQQRVCRVTEKLFVSNTLNVYHFFKKSLP